MSSTEQLRLTAALEKVVGRPVECDLLREPPDGGEGSVWCWRWDLCDEQQASGWVAAEDPSEAIDRACRSLRAAQGIPEPNDPSVLYHKELHSLRAAGLGEPSVLYHKALHYKQALQALVEAYDVRSLSDGAAIWDHVPDSEAAAFEAWRAALMALEASLPNVAVAVLLYALEMSTEVELVPRCAGKWVSGSGGHRDHEPCNRLATWALADDCWAYCDEHITEHERGTPGGYFEVDYAQALRAAYKEAGR